MGFKLNDIPYPSFYRAYKELSTNYWIPDEVDMKSDAKQYPALQNKKNMLLMQSLAYLQHWILRKHVLFIILRNILPIQLFMQTQRLSRNKKSFIMKVTRMYLLLLQIYKNKIVFLNLREHIRQSSNVMSQSWTHMMTS